MKITHDDLARFIPALSTPGPKTVLHVGCGTAGPERLPDCYKTGEWSEVRVDINPGVKPHIVATLTDLKEVPDASVHSIWSSHSLEHLNDFEVPNALAEFLRVLRPGGFALVTLPDLEQIAQLIADGRADETLYVSPAGPITPVDMLFGHQATQKRGNIHMAHRTGFTTDRLGFQLQKAGFTDIRIKRGMSIDLWAVAVKN